MFLKSLNVLGFLSQFVSKPVPQPDNAEYLLQKSGVTVEACMAGIYLFVNHSINLHLIILSKKNIYYLFEDKYNFLRAIIL